MSFAPSCQQPDQTLEFHATLWTNAGVAGLAKAYEGEETVKVPCGPLQPVLEDIFAGGEAIDFFSLDVEGAEPLVLETIDFTKVQIHVMLIEVANSFCKKEDCEQRNRVREIMKKAGYQQYKGMVSGSDVFVHPNSPYQLA
ncbi:expressed unknown protein [Seminavis robusta]|uniref:Methyltransferase FkbM domain-containing protein n=1 Tax=Seminavis robusta TaxID=568900 RepID=A0A9N8F1R4_9STRA|nr:expressed unknown protein [Seminavis robusta]|eukprot:Sro4720_g354530.1 n/a (141) ;mRNA; r:600-1022